MLLVPVCVLVHQETADRVSQTVDSPEHSTHPWTNDSNVQLEPTVQPAGGPTYQLDRQKDV